MVPAILIQFDLLTKYQLPGRTDLSTTMTSFNKSSFYSAGSTLNRINVICINTQPKLLCFDNNQNIVGNISPNTLFIILS